MGNRKSAYGFDRVDHFYVVNSLDTGPYVSSMDLGKFEDKCVHSKHYYNTLAMNYVLVLEEAIARGDKWIVVVHMPLNLPRANAMTDEFFKKKKGAVLLLGARPAQNKHRISRTRRIENFKGMCLHRNHAKRLVSALDELVHSNRTFEDMLERAMGDDTWYSAPP